MNKSITPLECTLLVSIWGIISSYVGAMMGLGWGIGFSILFLIIGVFLVITLKEF